MNRKFKLIFSIIILAFISLGGFYIYNNFINTKSSIGEATKNTIIIVGDTVLSQGPSNIVEQTPIVDIPNDSTGQADSSISSQVKNWDKTVQYNTGEKVNYNGKTYESKWWNQGTEPSSNEAGPWKIISTPDSTTPTPPNDKPAKEPENNEPVSKPLNSKFKVVGYFPEWKPEKEKAIQYGKLTHINYAFAIPKSDGTLHPLVNPSLAKRIINNGHKHNTKVLIAVGGWEYKGTPLEGTFVEATNTDAKCKKLANNILSLVDRYGFDGVDMDWEHPRTDGNSKNQYATLMKYLRQGLTKRGKLLTSAVLAGVSADGNVLWDAAGHLNSVLESVDWLNVMAYDGGDGDRHSSYNFAVASANYWIKTRKVPKSKVVLGVPFYGRPSWASYEEILQADPNAYKKDVATIQGKQAHYNGIPTIKKKTEWALKNAGGIMIWEISQDSTNQSKSLLNAIYQTVIKR